MGEVVTGIRKGLEGKLIVTTFGFLHQQDIDVASMEKIHHERKSGPNRVHVPGRNLHPPV